jgi:hypothetical protein
MAKSLKKEVYAELTPCMRNIIIIGAIIITIIMMVTFQTPPLV